MIELVTHYDEQLIAPIRSLLSQLTQQPIIFGEEELRALIASLLRQFSQDKLNRGVSAFADVNGFE